MSNILVIDDNAANRSLIVTLCEHLKHACFEAADGKEGLQAAITHKPDLIICDILMPTIDGYEFVRLLREDADIAHTEVIFYTANYFEAEARSLAEAIGVRRIISKPCAPAEMIRIIEDALAQKPVPQSFPEQQAFDREHLRLISNKLAQKANELVHTNQRLTSMIDLNLQLASVKDSGDLLKRVCHGACELIGAQHAYLCVREKGNGVGIYLYTSGLSETETERLPSAEMHYDLMAKALDQWNDSRIVNPKGDPSAIGFLADYPEIRQGLVAPITSLSYLYGWLFLANKQDATEFSEEDAYILPYRLPRSGVSMRMAAYIHK